MANSAQAKKRARQAETHRAKNASQRSTIRTNIKNVDAAIATGDYEAAREAFNKAEPVIDALAAKNVIHKNKAARSKSRLSARVKGLKS